MTETETGECRAASDAEARESSHKVYPEQQRYWISLLNLQRAWTSDEAALGFLPPRYRDFESSENWPRRKALTFLLNNLELIRESHRRLEAGETLDYDLLNHGLGLLTLRLHPWNGLADLRQASRAKSELGGRLETLQVASDLGDLNPGTRYIRATIERSLYYFAQYVDERLSDPAYPEVSEDRWQIAYEEDGSGDLVLQPPEGRRTTPGGEP